MPRHRGSRGPVQAQPASSESLHGGCASGLLRVFWERISFFDDLPCLFSCAPQAFLVRALLKKVSNSDTSIFKIVMRVHHKHVSLTLSDGKIDSCSAFAEPPGWSRVFSVFDKP